MRNLEVSEQRGGAPFDEVEQLGTQLLRDVLKIFDERPWAAEARVSQDTGMCAPTLTLEDSGTGEVFWVSPYLSGDTLFFVNEYRYRLRERGFLSRLTGRTHRSPRTRELDLQQARRGLEHFANSQHEKLLALVAPS